MAEIPKHLIEQAWEMYLHHTRGNGLEPDKLNFLCGVASLHGILMGTLPVGIPEGTQTFDVMVAIQTELSKYRAEIAALEEQAKKRQN